MSDYRTEYTGLVEPLSEREMEILLLMAQGSSNAEIGDQLSLALSTVKWYNTQIYSKLGVASRADAIRQARLLGLFEEADTHREELPNNLPGQLTPFVGRLEELGELSDLLQDDGVRLVTILAPGGMGKTRLGVQLAQQQNPFFHDGVFFISLAPLQSADLITGTIMETLGFRVLPAGDQMLTLSDFLAGRKLLLLLDNFEHLLSGAQVVSDMLQAAPNLKVLVTSRERLNLRGETVYTLNGLPVPADSDMSAIRSSDATRLFVQSARRARPDFTLTDYDLPHIARITALVGGMPLALELAAGWMDVLTPERIAAEVKHCIDILETELRDVPERHRSMRAIFNHIWNDLSEQDRTIFMRLAAFRGGFTAEAAREICGADLRDLRRLTNKALIISGFGGRYDIHELLRQFSEEKLLEAGSKHQIDSMHSRHYMNLIIDEYVAAGGRRSINYRRLEIEIENILAAWTHILEQQDIAEIARVQEELMWFLGSTGYLPDAIESYRRAADLVGKAALENPALKPLYGRLLASRIDMETHIYPYENYQDTLREAIELMELEGPSEQLAWAYCMFADFEWQRGNLTQEGILNLLDTIKERLDALNIPHIDISFLQIMGTVHDYLGNHEQALELAQEAYRRVHDLDISDYLAYQCCDLLAHLLRQQGRLDEAIQYWEETLEYAEQSGVIHTRAHAHTMLSRTYLRLENLELAKAHMKQVLLIHKQDARDWQTLGALYGAYARHYLMVRGEYDRAVMVCSFVANHPLAMGSIRIDAAEILAQAQQHLTPQAYEAACKQSQRLTIRELLRDAISELSA